MSDGAVISLGGMNHDNITRENYTSSLLEEALRAGVIDGARVDVIRTGLMDSLAEVISYYTKNESSSIKGDSAKELLRSMMYNIDTYLLSLENDEAALAALLDRKAGELYGKGYLINTKHYETAKNLYGKARLTRLKNGGDNYNRTLDRYFRNYLSDYSPKFSAHDKIYLTLREYGLTGAYHIDEAVEVLKKICEINRGPKADVII